jgi:hypothetical protein
MAKKAPPGKPFTAGDERINKNGRARGSRNKLNADFIAALSADFDKHGEEAIRVCRVETPATYLKIIAGTLPAQFHVEAHAIVKELPDDEIDALLEAARRQLLQQSTLDATRIDAPFRLLPEPTKDDKDD